MNSDFASSISRSHIQRSLVKSVGREDVEIRGEPKIKKATASVEGFTSVVLRVEISYGFSGDDDTIKNKVFVVKCMPKMDYQVQLAKNCNIFVREGRYFEEVVPIMQKVSRGKVEIPLPAVYEVVLGGDNDGLYMEDLAESGFQTPPSIFRSQGIDLQHCLVAMETLGKLHALLIAAEKSLPIEKGGWVQMIPEFSRDAIFFDSLPEEPVSPLVGMFERGIENLLHFAKEFEGVPKEGEASGKLKTVSNRAWDTIIELLKPNKNGRNVLNHGDCWMNNVMFRYEKDSNGKQQPVDAKFIDFQIVRYCSPCIDLLHFIYMGTTKPFRDRHLDRLIKEYYDSLEKTLKDLNVIPPFTLEELKSDYHVEYKSYGVILGMVFMLGLRLGDDIFPTSNEELSPKEFEELFETDYATVVIRKRFEIDPEYRTIVEDAVREFVDVAFPDGLENLESTPMLL